MAYAALNVDVRTDPRWHDVPAKLRAAAKAIYVDAILYSAEMLKDGQVSRAVLVEIAHENGLFRPSKTVSSLCDAHLLARTKTGVLIIDWRRFHSGRTEVEERRRRDVERKRGKRDQPELPGMPNGVHLESAAESAGNLARAYAPARTAAAADTQDLDSKVPVAREPEDLTITAAAAALGRIASLDEIDVLLRPLKGYDPSSLITIGELCQSIPHDALTIVIRYIQAKRGVRNEIGLLNKLIGATIRERARTSLTNAASDIAPPNVKTPEQLIRLHAPALAHLDNQAALNELEQLLGQRGIHDLDRVPLLNLAADILRDTRAATTDRNTNLASA